MEIPFHTVTCKNKSSFLFERYLSEFPRYVAGHFIWIALYNYKFYMKIKVLPFAQSQLKLFYASGCISSSIWGYSYYNWFLLLVLLFVKFSNSGIKFVKNSACYKLRTSGIFCNFFWETFILTNILATLTKMNTNFDQDLPRWVDQDATHHFDYFILQENIHYYFFIQLVVATLITLVTIYFMKNIWGPTYCLHCDLPE